jgi:hypothetical protein
MDELITFLTNFESLRVLHLRSSFGIGIQRYQYDPVVYSPEMIAEFKTKAEQAFPGLEELVVDSEKELTWGNTYFECGCDFCLGYFDPGVIDLDMVYFASKGIDGGCRL